MSNLPWSEILSFKLFDVVKVLLTAVIILFVQPSSVFDERSEACLATNAQAFGVEVW